MRSARPYVTAHVHNDLGSVTFNSYGTEFVGDPGPYRYDNSAIRDYMVSRSGHSVVRVTELKAKKQPAKKASLSAKQTRTGSEYNQTCITDKTYVAARINRCVVYDAGIDALVVTDTIKSRKRVRIDQRWQVPPGVTVAAEASGATLTSPNAAARMLLAGGGAVRTYRPTSKRQDGWFTKGYGELVKGTVLQRRVTLPKKSTVTLTAVLAAGTTAPSVSLDGNVVTVGRETTSSFTLP